MGAQMDRLTKIYLMHPTICSGSISKDASIEKGGVGGDPIYQRLSLSLSMSVSLSVGIREREGRERQTDRGVGWGRGRDRESPLTFSASEKLPYFITLHHSVGWRCLKWNENSLK